MTNLFFSFFFLLGSWTSAPKPATDQQWFCEDNKYSYQIEVIGTRAKVQLPTTICGIIEENRKDSEDSYYNYSRYVRIHIFSKQKVNAGLKPIDQVIYVEA